MSKDSTIFGILLFFVLLFGLFTIIIGIPALGENYRKDKEIVNLKEQVKYQQKFIKKLEEGK